MTETRTVAELAEAVGGDLVRGDPTRALGRVMAVDAAAADAVTFVTKPKYLPLLEATQAGAVLISRALLEERAPAIAAPAAVIAVANAYTAFARAAQLFAPAAPAPAPGVHPSAVIDATASLGSEVAVGAHCWIGPGAVIGDGASLHAGVHVEARARIGAGTILYNHVVVRHGCEIGARCVLHPGAVIGADGFGFAQDIEAEETRHLKIPQIGTVVIEDEVEIGANSCVDRAALGVTRIGRGTKIDNLVQIGHNVELGPSCILVAQSGVAGSARLARGVILGAQSGVSGHIEVGEGATVYGQAGVMEDLAPHQKVAGSPAVTAAEFFRSVVRVGKLEEVMSRLKKVEQWIANGRGR
ncbi:MAG: UDP-3-O-(3-hydroxymyristoyl)glucosamine N-acyltransferase [Deltaproteobacteria bacterium]|nr:UDP-3-O-(3-hydroxymyristoyl)glucosamine N-acyltransferase [Deltaproteobacteria bacterium]